MIQHDSQCTEQHSRPYDFYFNDCKCAIESIFIQVLCIYFFLSCTGALLLGIPRHSNLQRRFDGLGSVLFNGGSVV